MFMGSSMNWWVLRWYTEGKCAAIKQENYVKIIMILERFNILPRHFTQWRNAPLINQDMQPSCLTFLGLFTLLAIIRSLCIIRLVRYAVGRDLSAGRHDLPRPHLRRWEPRSVPFGALVLGWFCHRYFKTDIYIYIYIFILRALKNRERKYSIKQNYHRSP